MPFIDAAGHRIEYERIGDSPGSRPSLVFLHEGLGSITGWGDFPGRLARATGLAGVAYNRAGHGRSGPLTGPRTIRFMHDEALDVLPSVLSSLGVERPILIGHSDGASIALIFASHHPSLVRGLALEAPHVIVEPETAGGIADARRRFRAGALRERLRRHHFENTESMFETWAEVWLSDAFRSVVYPGRTRIRALPGLRRPGRQRRLRHDGTGQTGRNGRRRTGHEPRPPRLRPCAAP